MHAKVAATESKNNELCLELRRLSNSHDDRLADGSDDRLLDGSTALTNSMPSSMPFIMPYTQTASPVRGLWTSHEAFGAAADRLLNGSTELGTHAWQPNRHGSGVTTAAADALMRRTVAASQSVAKTDASWRTRTPVAAEHFHRQLST